LCGSKGILNSVKGAHDATIYLGFKVKPSLKTMKSPIPKEVPWGFPIPTPIGYGTQNRLRNSPPDSIASNLIKPAVKKPPGEAPGGFFIYASSVSLVL
jgi:hypothetical protein